MSGVSGQTPTLETDLSTLMAALRQHGGEEWTGKPAQENFRVYTPLTDPSTTDAAPRTDESSSTVAADDRPGSASAAVVDASSSPSSTAQSSSHQTPSPHEKRSGSDDARGSLDALMSEYVTALRGLRAAERTEPKAEANAEGSTTEGAESSAVAVQQPGVSAAGQCVPSASATRQSTTPPPAVDLDADLQSFLSALDQLPPLPRR